MIEYIQEHQAGFWVAIGFLMLTAELLIFGLSTLLLLLGGLAAVTTGILIYVGILPDDWYFGFGSFGILSAAYGFLLWKPLQRFQNSGPAEQKPTSDLVGMDFVLDEEITSAKPGTTRYSGVSWRVEVAREAGVDLIEAGKRVEVVSVDAGIFRVKPV